MLTPIEIQGKVFKSGIGYDKKEVDVYLKEILADYEKLYKENVELNEKMNVLSEGIQYYKTIEKTLQKALVLAEKTAEETQNAAENKAAAIIENANVQAQQIAVDAKKNLDRLHVQTMNLAAQYDKFRIQFKQLAATQLDLLSSEAFDLKIANLDTFTPQETKIEKKEESMEELPTIELPKDVFQEEKADSVTQEKVKTEDPVEEQPVAAMVEEQVKAAEVSMNEEPEPIPEPEESISSLMDQIVLNPEVTNFDIPETKKEEEKEQSDVTTENQYDMHEVTFDEPSSDFEFMDMND